MKNEEDKPTLDEFVNNQGPASVAKLTEANLKRVDELS
jgi:hypothetical protein